MNAPIFITGTQRSGTTLLCRMLTAHPNIFIKNEMPNPVERFSGHNTKNDIIEAINLDMPRTSLPEILKQTGKSTWGLKDPRLTYCLESLIHTFKDGKVLIIVRDGRAVATSYMNARWGVATNIYCGAERWRKEIGLQKQFVKRHPEKCHVIKYEELIQKPEHELRSICAFLGEDYAESMCKYWETQAYIRKTKDSKNTFKPLDKDRMHSWKKKLTPFQISVFETVAGDALQDNAYELVGETVKMSTLLKRYYIFHQTLIGEIQLQYQWRVKPRLKKMLKI